MIDKHMTVPVEMLWIPPWADNLLEDRALQEKAADRLRTYLVDGRIYAGSHSPAFPLQVVRAEVATASRSSLDDGSNIGIRWAFELSLKIGVT